MVGTTANEPRPNLSPTIIDGNDAQLPAPYGKPAGTIFFARDTGITRIIDIDNAGLSSWKVVSMGAPPPGANDFPLVYVVDSQATGAAFPAITPVTGRGPFLTIEAAMAQVTADRVTFGASYPAVVMLNRGVYTPAGGTLTVPENVALVSFAQQPSNLVQIVGNILLGVTTGAASLTLSGLQVSGQLLISGTDNLTVNVQSCDFSDLATPVWSITNTGAGTVLTARNCRIVQTAAAAAIGTNVALILEGCDVTNGISQNVDGIPLSLINTRLTVSAAQNAIILSNGSTLYLRDTEIGYPFAFYAVDAPPAGAKPAVTQSGAVTMYPIGGNATNGPLDMLRLTLTPQPSRRGLNSVTLLATGGGGANATITSDVEYAHIDSVGAVPDPRADLPYAVGLAQGTMLIIKNFGPSDLNVFPQVGETIDGAASIHLVLGKAIQIIAQPQGSTWDLVSFT